MMFLDPKNLIVTCESSSCDDCPAGNILHCHFALKDWIHFLPVRICRFCALPDLLEIGFYTPCQSHVHSAAGSGSVVHGRGPWFEFQQSKQNR